MPHQDASDIEEDVFGDGMNPENPGKDEVCIDEVSLYVLIVMVVYVNTVVLLSYRPW